jgi:hypothetical protein
VNLGERARLPTSFLAGLKACRQAFSSSEKAVEREARQGDCYQVFTKKFIDNWASGRVDIEYCSSAACGTPHRSFPKFSALRDERTKEI